MSSSDYINDQRKEYSLYTLQMRAIPYAADGLKAAARRVLWTARNGKKFKCATLAGATMPIHPHDAPESVINTLAAPYRNNVPLFKGEGAFGTLLKPTAYGASRYTSVSISQFTKDVLFKDIEIIPIVDNYDETLKEPKHFLPLIPIALLNPQQGVAVGFASTILPRDLPEIIQHQIEHLQNGRTAKIHEVHPTLVPINQRSVGLNENGKWMFEGYFERLNTTKIRVINLPYTLSRVKFIEKIAKLENEGCIIDVEDNSKNQYNIELKFKRGYLSNISDEDLIKLLGLRVAVSENLNVIDFEGDCVWSTNYTVLLQHFTDWRLGWYETRYQRLAGLVEDDIQKYKDILLAIRKNVGSLAKRITSRSDLRKRLIEFGIVNDDYIADLPVYRFTAEEKIKVEQNLKAAHVILKEYKKLLRSKNERCKVYVSELNEILTAYNNGAYVTMFE